MAASKALAKNTLDKKNILTSNNVSYVISQKTTGKASQPPVQIISSIASKRPSNEEEQ